jgi:hypothetical protein
MILRRLEEEDETELAGALRKCGAELILVCTNCGHHHPVETKCRQKWCPVCVRQIATKRSLKFAAAAAAMQWPLFVTLTVENVKDARTPFVRKLRRDLGKLRHSKLWKKNVRGGVAAIEVTNKGRGWHPHLHALIDCRWLALKTPRPQAGESRDSVKQKCRAAKRELTNQWKRTTKEKHGVCWIQRADGETCAREVLKYSIKGSELAEFPDRIGPIIHQLRATRLTTSFGSLFGKLRIIDPTPAAKIRCEECGEVPEWMTLETVDRLRRKTKP